jgi:hypothetical protein
VSVTSKHRRELAYEIAKLRGLQKSVDPAVDDSETQALALQIRDQAEICLHVLDQYQSSVPGRMWLDAERRCRPLREDLRRTGIQFRSTSGEMALRTREQVWGKSWWAQKDVVLPSPDVVHDGDDGAYDQRVEPGPEIVMDGEALEADRSLELVLIDLGLDPDPQLFSTDPGQMTALVTILVGPPPEGGGEVFRATICTPEWMAAQSENGSFLPGNGLLVVSSTDFDERRIRAEVEGFLAGIQEDTWGDVVTRIKEWFPYWEFDELVL